MKKVLKIATRQSPLALWQAEYVKSKLSCLYPDLEVELIKMVTQGDKILDVSLSKIGGKGLFIKELEQGMLDGIADIAVHSMKDVPMKMPEGFKLAVICERETPFDAFVSNNYDNLDSLPIGAVVGTSSLRRKSQLLLKRPDLKVKDLRGNVNTRLSKLDLDEFDAIILAAAGLVRLGMADRIRHEISPDVILPAVGQGAVGIEILEGADEIADLIAPLNCVDTSIRVTAERAMNLKLEGGCQVPIAGYATLEKDEVYLQGLVASVDGSKVIKSEIRGNKKNAKQLGDSLGMELLSCGADEVLQEVYLISK